jgi:acyl carrier protein
LRSDEGPNVHADNEAKLKRTLAEVLGIPESGIGEDTSMDTVAEWDSLKHLNLVLALEERFGLSLTEEQSFEILSYPLIKAVLEEHGVAFG